jgi:hypothetical protein
MAKPVAIWQNGLSSLSRRASTAKGNDMRHSALPQIVLAITFLPMLGVADDDATRPTVTGIVVDEAGDPVPGAVVELQTGLGNNPRVTTDVAGRFAAETPRRCKQIIAQGPNRDLIGYLNLVRADSTRDLQVVLKPARTIEVTVTFEGQPVPEAFVQVNAWQLAIGVNSTDAEGHCRLAIPRDAIIEDVVAFKQGVGFNTWSAGRNYYAMEADNSPDAYNLELWKAGEMTVRVYDRDGQPVSGARAYAGWMQIPGGSDSMDAGVCEPLYETTDAEGRAVFNVFPESAQVSFGAWIPDEYHMLGYAIRRPDTEGDVTIEVWPMGTVAGTVFGRDGRPAPGIHLRIYGLGPESAHSGQSAFNKEATTDAQGRYEFRIPPDHPYMLGVDDPSVAAMSLSGMLPAEVERLDEQNLQLIAGTRFHGAVRYTDGTPLDESQMGVFETSPPRQVNIDGRQIEVELRLGHWVSVDEAGQFETLLAPGSYLASYMGNLGGRPQYFEFDVTDQAEVSHDFRFERIPTEELRGRVVRSINGVLEPAANVAVTGVPFDRFASGLATYMTNERGEFAISWQGGQLFLHAQSANGDLATTQMIEGATDAVEDLVLVPTTSASGQVLEDGRPLVDFRIDYTLNIQENTYYGQFSSYVVTDAEGRFTIDGLIQNSSYRCWHDVWGSMYPVVTIAVENDEPIELGEITYDASRRLRNVEERISDAFLGGDDAGPKLETALRDARFLHQHVLLVVGEPDSDAVVNLFRLFFEAPVEFNREPELRNRLRDFELCGIIPESASSSDIPAIHEVGASGQATLIILNTEGSAIGTLSESEFIADGTVQSSVVEGFLNAHRPPPLDGAALLNSAMEAAAASEPDKLILVHEVDTFLPKSRSLSRFFAGNSESLSEHFVYVPIEYPRIASDAALLDQISGDDFNGYSHNRSWIGLLTADGTYIGGTEVEGLSTQGWEEDADRVITFLMEHAPQIGEQELGAWLDELSETSPYGH